MPGYYLVLVEVAAEVVVLVFVFDEWLCVARTLPEIESWWNCWTTLEWEALVLCYCGDKNRRNVERKHLSSRSLARAVVVVVFVQILQRWMARDRFHCCRSCCCYYCCG